MSEVDCNHYYKYSFLSSLVDASEADAASSVNQHLRRVWVCLNCQETMIVNMAEELSHRGECELLQSKKRVLHTHTHVIGYIFEIGTCLFH